VSKIVFEMRRTAFVELKCVDVDGRTEDAPGQLEYGSSRSIAPSFSASDLGFTSKASKGVASSLTRPSPTPFEHSLRIATY